MEHCNGIMHTVRSGDTLYSISMEHKVPLALLLRANPYVDVYNLQVGETICVPVKGNLQGGMPPYGRSCDRCEVKDAVPLIKDIKEKEAGENVAEEKETGTMQPVEGTSENTGKATEQKENIVMEETAMRDEVTGENVYVTREGDSLEKILGVNEILLQPGITIYRQK